MSDQLQNCLQAELLSDVRPVDFDRLHAQVKLLGDLARADPGADELEHLELAVAQTLDGRRRGCAAAP